MNIAVIVFALLAGTTSPPAGESAVPKNILCWSAFTFNPDGTERRVGSGRIGMPPGSTQEDKDRAEYLAVERAFRLDNTNKAPMSQSLADLGPVLEFFRRCKECDGSGAGPIRIYPGVWATAIQWCFRCKGHECHQHCRPQAGFPCPPGC